MVGLGRSCTFCPLFCIDVVFFCDSLTVSFSWSLSYRRFRKLRRAGFKVWSGTVVGNAMEKWKRTGDWVQPNIYLLARVCAVTLVYYTINLMLGFNA